MKAGVVLDPGSTREHTAIVSARNCKNEFCSDFFLDFSFILTLQTEYEETIISGCLIIYPGPLNLSYFIIHLGINCPSRSLNTNSGRPRQPTRSLKSSG